MDTQHYNELISLAQEIYNDASDRINNYCAGKYCGIGHDTEDQQLQDCLFITEEAAAFIYGNALALLDPETQEKAISQFTDNLRRVIAIVSKKQNRKPN